MRQIFTLKDYIALFLLSLRSFFWRVDGKQSYRDFNKAFPNASGAFILLSLFIMIGLPIYCFNMLKDLIAGESTLGSFLYEVYMAMISMAGLLFIICNPRRLRYALRYRSTEWYKNTGYKPWTVINDVGLYGEYIATMCEECFLLKNGVQGYVFNNVIVPKKDGDFNEIDVLSVSPLGIHVIEAKARVGQFYGTLISPKWTQVLGNNVYEMDNPLMQNLTHINYLIDYLWEQLPAGKVKEFFRKERYLIESVKNVVLFTLTGINSQINPDKEPNIDYCMCMAESKYTHIKHQPKILGEKEVEAIAEIIRKIASYSPSEVKTMMWERQRRQENREFSHPYMYKNIKIFDEENGQEGIVLCRDNGYHYSIYDPNDGTYKSRPEMEILEVGRASRDFRTVYERFQRGEL